MKNYNLSLFLIAISIVSCVAQVPQGINYQAVARNSVGNPVMHQLVNVRFTIHNGNSTGAADYSETDTATTNQFGLFSTVIGYGVPVTSTFPGINWNSGQKFLQVEIDPAGGANFTNMGTTQLVSVPYALRSGSTDAQNVAFKMSNITNGTLDWFDNDTGTVVNFGNVDYDYSSSAGSGTFTAPSTGIYHFDVNMSFTVFNTDIDNYAYFTLYLNKDWNQHVEEVYVTPAHSSQTNMSTLSISTDVYLTTGEYVYVSYDGYASPLTNGVHSPYGTFSGHKVR